MKFRHFNSLLLAVLCTAEEDCNKNLILVVIVLYADKLSAHLVFWCFGVVDWFELRFVYDLLMGECSRRNLGVLRWWIVGESIVIEI